MGELPDGRLTLLFTDVEGSTRLLHELGDGYAAVLAEHRRVLREAFARHGGREVDTQGDAFFYVFRSAEEALAAAGEGCELLESGPIRVRIGVHTGTPTPTNEGYVGADVHLAARMAPSGMEGRSSCPTRRAGSSAAPPSCSISASTGSRTSTTPSRFTSSGTSASRR